MANERLWTTKEAAAYLKVTQKTITRRCRAWRDSKGAYGIRHRLLATSKRGRFEIRIPESAIMESLEDPSTQRKPRAG